MKTSGMQAAAKEISFDASVAPVLSELDAFCQLFWWKSCFCFTLHWFWQEFGQTPRHATNVTPRFNWKPQPVATWPNWDLIDKSFILSPPKFFFHALSQMEMWNFFCGFGKRSIWRVRLNDVAVDFTPTWTNAFYCGGHCCKSTGENMKIICSI